LFLVRNVSFDLVCVKPPVNRDLLFDEYDVRDLMADNLLATFERARYPGDNVYTEVEH